MICKRCGAQTLRRVDQTQWRCTQCGALTYDERQEEQQFLFERNYAQGMAFLRVGQYGKALDIMRKLTEDHPDDKRLYQTIIRASTRGLQELEYEHIDPAASQAWDVLVQLNGLTGDLVQYGRKLIQYEREKMLHRKMLVVLCVTLCLVLAVACWLFMYGMIGGEESSVYALGCMVAIGLIIHRVRKTHPSELFEALSQRTQATSNPFRYGVTKFGRKKW